MGIIYEAEAYDTVNWMRYIGKSEKGLEERRKKHIEKAREGRKTCFYDVLLVKPETFVWSILEDDVPDDQLSERERFWIDELDNMTPNGYNMDSGGRGGQRTGERR